MNVDTAAELFLELGEIARICASPGAGWAAMCALAEARLDGSTVQMLRALNLDEDARDLATAMKQMLRDEPPPAIDTLYFGLFDAIDDDDVRSAGLYVAGLERFDANDGDSMCNPKWRPEAGSFSSDVLNRIFTAARSEPDEDRQMTLDYALRFGAAALLARFATREVPIRVVVGFDDGDFAEVAPGRS